MNEAVQAFPNRCFYNDRLRAHRAAAGRAFPLSPRSLDALGDEEPRLTWLAGAEGPRRYEVWSVEALLAGGSSELAVLYGRMVADAGVRAMLLAHCLERMPAGEGAAGLGEEGASAMLEAHAAGVAPPLDAALARVPGVSLASGDPERAEELLGSLLDELLPATTAAWTTGTALLQASLQDAGAVPLAIARRMADGWEQRVAAADLEEQLELLLAWLTLRSTEPARG